MKIYKTTDSSNNVIYHYIPLSKHGGSLNLENCRNSVVFLGPSSLIDKAKISLVGENCVFFADSGLGRAEISVYNGCCLYIGSGCCINPAGTQRIAVAEASSIIIGNGAWFSYPVDIRTSDWHPVYDVSTRARVNQAESIILGDHVWVCRDCSIYKVNCEFEKSAQMSHLCRFHPFGVQQRWGGCLPPLSPPTTERASRSLLWIPLCGTAFD